MKEQIGNEDMNVDNLREDLNSNEGKGEAEMEGEPWEEGDVAEGEVVEDDKKEEGQEVEDSQEIGVSKLDIGDREDEEEHADWEKKKKVLMLQVVKILCKVKEKNIH